MEKSSLIKLGAVLVAAGLGAYALHQWRYLNRYVATDNAQLEGVIVPVRARVSGLVQQVLVAENDLVQPQAPLVQIRPLEFEQRVNQARADYAALMANAGKGAGPGVLDSQVKGAAAAGAAAAATIEQQQANLGNARADLVRIENLWAQGVMSAQALDAARARVQALSSGVQAARQTAAAAQENTLAQRAGLRAQDYKIVAAQAQLALAEIQLGDTRISAPGLGAISRKNVEPGQFVTAGQLLMNLTSTRDVWVVANLKETDVGRVLVGQPVRVVVDAYPDRDLGGQVASLGAATGAKFSLLPQENATGNFTKVVQRVPVKIRLDLAALDPQLLLRPGMSAFVEIKTGKE